MFGARSNHQKLIVFHGSDTAGVALVSAVGRRERCGRLGFRGMQRSLDDVQGFERRRLDRRLCQPEHVAA